MTKINAGEFYQGDYLVESLKIKSESVDLVLTDPPYGITSPVFGGGNYTADKPRDVVTWDAPIDVTLLLKNISRVLRAGGRAVIFGGGKTSVDLLAFYGRAIHKLRLSQRAVWVKPSSGFNFGCRFNLVGCFEDIFIFTKRGGKPIFNRPCKKAKKNVFCYPLQRTFKHPTKKPERLLEDLIKTYSNKGDTVADFFSGSGSTGVACENTGRNYILIERDPLFFEGGQLRCQAAADEAFQELKFLK
jgi:DNA modification methylase